MSPVGNQLDSDHRIDGAEPTAPRRRHARRRDIFSFSMDGPALLSSFALAEASFFLLISSWSLATPLFSGPDEPAQVIHAAAVVRGEWIGSSPGPGNATTVVHVPAALADGSAEVKCFTFDRSIPGFVREIDSYQQSVGHRPHLRRKVPTVLLRDGGVAVAAVAIFARRLRHANYAFILERLGFRPSGRCRHSLVAGDDSYSLVSSSRHRQPCITSGAS